MGNALSQKVADNLLVEQRVLWERVHDDSLGALDQVATEVVRATSVQQHRMAAAEEVRARAAHLSLLRVFRHGTERHVLRGAGRGKVIADADEVEVRRDEDEDAFATFFGLGQPGQGWYDGAGEVLEARVRVVGWRWRVVAVECLLDRQANIEHGAFIRGLDLDLAGNVAHVLVEKRVKLGCEVGREHNCLPEMRCLVVEIPGPHTAEVAAVGVLWLEVQMREDVFYVLPVLHEHGIGLVDDDELNRAEEVVVCFLFTVHWSASNRDL